MRQFADGTVLLFTPTEADYSRHGTQQVAYIRNHPSKRCQWRGTDGSIVTDAQLDDLWRAGKVAVLHNPANGDLSDIDVPLEIGDGWVPLVTATLRAMRSFDPMVRIEQVKEKFGELRLYWSSDLDPATHNDQRKMIEMAVEYAETRSKEICESCGKPGNLDEDNGWYRTLCTEDRTTLLARKDKAKQRIDHSGHNHPATTEARSYCRLTGDTGAIEELQS